MKNQNILLNTQIFNDFGQTPLLVKTLKNLKKIFPDRDQNDFMIKEEQDRLMTLLMCINRRHANNSSFRCDPNMKDNILSYSLTYGELIKLDYYPWNITWKKQLY